MDEHERILGLTRSRDTIRVWEAGDIWSGQVTVRTGCLFDGRWFCEQMACRGVCDYSAAYYGAESEAVEAARELMREVAGRARLAFAEVQPRRGPPRR